MTAIVYYATTADEQLAQAQRTLDTHVTSSATGRCLACGAPGPCYKRETAVVIFSRTVRLPRRQPGATRPEVVAERRVGGQVLVRRMSVSPAQAGWGRATKGGCGKCNEGWDIKNDKWVPCRNC